MPYQTELTDDYMGIVHVGSGVVTGEELVAATKAAVQLVQNTENFQYELVDFTGVTELRIKDEHLEEIVAQDHFAAIFRPNATVVIIAPRDDLYQVALTWNERVADLGWNTHISRSRPEALQWLREHYPNPPLKAEQPPQPNEA